MPWRVVAPPQRWSSAFAWTVLSQFLLGGTRLALSIIIGRYLGKEVLGQTSALLSVATFIVLLWPQASGVAAAKFIATAVSSEQRDAWAASAAQSALLVAVPLGAAAALWSHVAFRPPTETLACVALLVVTMALSTVVRGVRNGSGQLAVSATGDGLGSLLGLIMMVVLVATDLESLVLLPVAVSFIPGVFLGWPSRASRIGPDQRNLALHFTAWTSLHILAAGSLLPLITILTALTTTREALGDFAAAASFATPLFLLSLAARSALEPFVAARSSAEGRQSAQQLVDALLRGMVAGFVPLFGASIIWSEQLLKWLYSPDFASASPVLVVLLTAVAVNSLNAAHVWLSGVDPRGPRKLALANVTGMAAGLSVAVPGLLYLGTTGAALGLLVGALVSTGISTIVVWSNCHMPWTGIMAKLACGALLIWAVGTLPRALEQEKLAGTGILLICWAALVRNDMRRVRALMRLVRNLS